MNNNNFPLIDWSVKFLMIHEPGKRTAVYRIIVHERNLIVYSRPSSPAHAIMKIYFQHFPNERHLNSRDDSAVSIINKINFPDFIRSPTSHAHF